MCFMEGESAFQDDILTVWLVLNQGINNFEICYVYFRCVGEYIFIYL